MYDWKGVFSMTEQELRLALADLEQSTPTQSKYHNQRRTRGYRRNRLIQERDDRVDLIFRRLGNAYLPSAGYVYGENFDPKQTLHRNTHGYHVTYMSNSNAQRYYKRLSARIVRRSDICMKKGNHYRRCFNYWNALY